MLMSRTPLLFIKFYIEYNKTIDVYGLFERFDRGMIRLSTPLGYWPSTAGILHDFRIGPGKRFGKTEEFRIYES